MVVVSTAETVFDEMLLTQTSRPFGDHATPIGDVPTDVTVPSTALVAVEMMETELDDRFATARRSPLGDRAIPRGLEPTAMEARAVPVDVL